MLFEERISIVLSEWDSPILKNPSTAPTTLVPAVLFYDSTAIQAGLILLFALTYVLLYWRIVRFKAPRWLVVRPVGQRSKG